MASVTCVEIAIQNEAPESAQTAVSLCIRGNLAVHLGVSTQRPIVITATIANIADGGERRQLCFCAPDSLNRCSGSQISNHETAVLRLNRGRGLDVEAVVSPECSPHKEM